MNNWEFALIAAIVLSVVLHLVVELFKINREIKRRTERLEKYKREIEECNRLINKII